MNILVEAKLEVVSDTTQEPLLPIETITFNQVCLHGQMEIDEISDLAVFHYSCKLLRDAQRVPEVKVVVKAKNYNVVCHSCVVVTDEG